MHIDIHRLWPRRPRDGSLPLGLSCDSEGLLLAGNCRLISAALTPEGQIFFCARPAHEINAVLSAGYGTAVDISDSHPRIERLAGHMSRGEWFRATLAALHLRLPELPDQAAARRVLEADRLLKLTWNSDLHPRWPAHSEEGRGGEFSSTDGSGSLLVPVQWQEGLAPALARILGRLLGRPPAGPETPFPRPPFPVRPQPKPPAEAPAPPGEAKPGLGHNNPPEGVDGERPSASPSETKKPPTEPPPVEVPKLPKEAPNKTIHIYRWGRDIADALADAARQGQAEVIQRIGQAVDAARWLKDQIPNIVSFLDPPKSYDELTVAAQQKGPHGGYEDHHIVEQGKHNDDLGDDLIQDPSNIVRIPYYKHKMIQSYYQRHIKSPPFNGLTPRQYLKGKSFEEQFQFGMDALRKFGVVK